MALINLAAMGIRSVRQGGNYQKLNFAKVVGYLSTQKMGGAYT